MAVDTSVMARRVIEGGQAIRRAAAAEMFDALREAAPVVTGELYDSIELVDRADVSTVRATAPQARWTDEGTVPHIIRVRNARVLVSDEGQIFGTEVHHPGYPGTRWWSDTLAFGWLPACEVALRSVAL